MKRLMIAVIVVVMSVSGQALAGSWAGVLGNYPSYYGGIYGGDYGYGLGGIISEVGRIQMANRVIDLAEKQQRQQSYVVREYVPVVNNQYFEDVRIKGKIQHLEDENQKLQQEVNKLKLELEKLRLQQEIQQRQKQSTK
ncbi:MAG: hypothetical protein COU42_00655 [Candidatus Nealsonbacteria bacterium CG10_big_fil_rev_8_21_14_0_10_36_24]|uniref:BZIP domain-containing protein n=1 Tax=Candidatus Nealsonbacteria bacterium CG10_big_fil_rev_8_21_14_0_10_36_24 TaxID=1974710 RepID=A0A2M6NTB4_9BACT|nr:MAG: hypothetical protein COU42_00655 [Candidatus Nealsonbacteria bacterium CG10_big_fil_rev_8_21_14_0_10_36_24]